MYAASLASYPGHFPSPKCDGYEASNKSYNEMWVTFLNYVVFLVNVTMGTKQQAKYGNLP